MGTITFTDATSPTTNITADLYGSYVLRWTETNGTCTQSDDVTIDFNEDPTGLSAGAGQDLCGVLTTALTGASHAYQAGSDHAGSTGLWTKVSGVGTITFTDATSPTTNITADLYGSYVLRWTETNGTCTQSDDVTIDFNEDPTGLSAGAGQDLCGVLTTALTGASHAYQAGSDHAGSTGLWTKVSGVGTITFTDATSPTTNITADLYGSYVLRWTETNGTCTQSDDVTIDFNEDPTGLSAGAGQDLCGVLTTALTGASHAYQAGSDHAGSTGLWTKVSGVGTITFTDATSPTTNITADLYGSYVLRWTETNGTCTQSDDVTIDFNEDPTGLSAGAGQDLCGVLTTALTGASHAYQAGSDHAGSTGLWTKVSGVGTITFTDATSPTTNITADLYGSYVLRWTETNGTCTQSDDVTIDFNEDPTGLSAGAGQDLCGVLTTALTGASHAYQAGSDHAGSTGLWTKVSGVGTITFTDATSPTTNITADLYGSYVLRWTETNGTCTQSDDVTIDFNEDPTGLSAGAGQDLCGVLTTALTGTSHAYQAGSDHAGSTGLWTKVSGVGTITFTDATDPKTAISANLYGSYVLRWTETNGTCTRSDDVTIWFDPTPVITAQNDIICDNGFTSIYPQTTTTNSLYGIRYTWTAEDVDNLITGESSSSGNGNRIEKGIIQQLNNPTDAPHQVIYHLTPWTIFQDSTLHCAGSTIDITIWINPTPRIFPVPLNSTQCDSTFTNIQLQSPSTFNSGLVTFRYTVTATGGVTGFSTPVSGLPNNHVIADKLINPTDSPQTVTYTIYPVSPTGCHDGPPVVITVTVNPTPRIFPVYPNTIQCDSTTTAILLQSPSTFTSGLITFKFIATATGGVTGFTASASGLPNNYVIADNLINPSDEPQTVTYVVTPVSPTGCPDGPSKIITVTVNPTPRIFPVPTNSIQCDSTFTNIQLQSPSTFTSGLVTFRYTVTATGGVTGFSTPVSGLPNNHVIADKLINPTDSPQTVTYTIYPVSPTGCHDGPPVVITVTVNPTPRIFPVYPNTIQCDSTTTAILLQSPSTFTSGLITFKFTATATGGVTGFTASASGLPNNYVIADNLINPTDAPQTVTYVVTPVSPTGCNDGPSKIITVTVNPTPRIFPVYPNTIQCDSTTTAILLQSPSTFTSGLITFKFTATATGGVTGFTASASGLPNNYVIADNLINPTDAPQTVTYVVTPVSPTGCNDGPSKIITVTVNPTPRIFPVYPNTIQCDSTTTAILLQSPSTFTSGPITFRFTATATGGVTGFTASASGLPNNYVIADNLINPTDAPQTVTYVVTPVSPTGCHDGPSKIITVTVNPTPRIFPVYPNTIQCDSTTTAILLQSPSTFTSGLITFKFTATATGGVTGFTASASGLPNNYIIADNLINPTDAPQTVTYVVTPVSPTGCNDGPSKIITVTVNPTPRIFPVPPNSIQCDSTFTNIQLQSPSTFTSGLVTFKYTAVASGAPGDVTGFTASASGLPNNYIISQRLINHTDSPQTVTYTLTPISGVVCHDGPAKIVIVTINPTPRIFPVYPNTIQCDSTTTAIMLQSPSTFTSGLISFDYTVTTDGPVTGYTTPETGLSNNHIIADMLVNHTDTFRLVTYRVVPKSPVGCLDGPAKDITVTVNPTPRVIPVNPNLKPDTSICYGTKDHIVLTSPTLMTSGDIRFDYSVAVTGGPGVIIGSTATEVNRIPGYTINFPYQNNSDTIQSVYYSIIPYNNAICTPGNKVISEVKVHAIPVDSIAITKPLKCDESGTSLGALAAVLSKGADPYQIVWIGPVGYHMTDSVEIANLSSGKYYVSVTDNLLCSRDDSIQFYPPRSKAYIYVTPIPPGIYNISCIGSTDGQITVSVIGTTPPYTYTVMKNGTQIFTGLFTNNYNPSDPGTFKVYTGLGAGTYTLIVADKNGCPGEPSSVIFRVPPPVVVEFGKSSYSGGYNISCKGYNDGAAWVQTISGGRGGYTYNWYTLDGNIPGPVNTNRIDNITAGTYYLEVRDVLGCLTVTSVVITEPDGMVLTDSQLSHSADGNYNISCNGGNDGSINLTIGGGSGNFLYSWTGPNGFSASTKDISGLYAGQYTCTVSDVNGCILTPSPSFTLTEPAILTVSGTSSTSNDGAYNINCNGGTGSIIITVTGGSVGNYNYTWSTTNGSGIVQGQKDQSALTAGTYHLEVTDLNNCGISADITLTQPPALVTSMTTTNITCQASNLDNGSIDLTVTGGVGPYVYLWSNGETTRDISGLTQGTYYVTVTYNGVCNSYDSATINLPPPLEYTKTLSDYNGYNISCNGLANGSIQIEPTSGLAPFIYSWTGPDGFVATSKDISNLKAGDYHLLITDSNFCITTETINLTEPGVLDISFTLSSSIAGGYNINCSGESTGTISVEPVNQVKTVDYLWADGVFGRTRNNLPAGDYHVIIIDANNCQASSYFTLTEPDSIKLNFDVTQPLCPDMPDGEIRLTVTGGVIGTDYYYHWSDNSSGRNISNILKGLYKVTVEDLNGCSVTDSVNIEPLHETCLVIPNAISPNDDLINDVWNIGMTDLYPEMEVKIFNRWGELIWRSEKGYPRPWDGTSHGARLPIDSYHYIIDLHNDEKPLIGTITIVK